MSDAAHENGTRNDNKVVSAVLVGLLVLLAQDPTLRQMAEVNDREAFIDGCNSMVKFPSKLINALLAIKEWGTTA
jgi:hypothetical protein